MNEDRGGLGRPGDTVGDSDGSSRRILQFPPPPSVPAAPDPHATPGEDQPPERQVPIIGRRELRELVVNVSRLLDAFDLYINQVRTLARVARDHPGVTGADIDLIIENAEVDGNRLGELRAAYRALADTLDEPDEDTPRDA